MSLVRPSFSQAFLNRRIICSAVSLPRDFTRIIQDILSGLDSIPTLFRLNRGVVRARRVETITPFRRGRRSDSVSDPPNGSTCAGWAGTARPTDESIIGEIDGKSAGRANDQPPCPIPRSGRDGLPPPQPIPAVFRDRPGRAVALSRIQLRRSG